MALLSAVALAGPAPAATVRVPARPGSLATALASAVEDDTLLLERGIHRGGVRLERRLVLRGEAGAVLDGGGRGAVLEVAAPHTVVEDLEIRGSGGRVLTGDAGVRLTGAHGTLLRRLSLRDVLYGIYVERSDRVRVEDCRLTGRVRPLDEGGEGNGIHLWYSRSAALAANQVDRFADGIYLSFANGARVEGSRLADNGRYGLHTMYCQDLTLRRNVFTRNAAGIAIMFSDRLEVEGNLMLRNRGPRTYGLLLRDCSAGAFVNNWLVENTVAVFMDNSNRNRFHGNLVQDNGWGVLLFSSCAGNEFSGNDFVHNDYPVALDMRRTDNRFDDGARGNYWSDSAPYDLDADGVSDVSYSPVGAFAFVSKQYPDLSVLAKSPAVAALAVAERVFPALRPSEAVDRFPLVHPVTRTPGPLVEEGPAAAPHWAAFGLFVAVAALGLLGLRRGRRFA